jgi:hypothetical protein
MVMKITFTIPDRSITRTKLEYPTENVSFAYLLAIDKARYATRIYRDASGLIASDVFADKAVESPLRDAGSIVARDQLDTRNAYRAAITIGHSASDFYIQKLIAGTMIGLGSEAVDLSDIFYPCKFSLSGSTLKGYRIDMDTPKITVTDTSFASGYFGAGHFDGAGRSVLAMTGAVLRPSSTTLPPALTIIEVEVEGGGAPEDPYRPSLSKNLVEIQSLQGLSSFLYQEAKKYEVLRAKGFTDDEIKLLLGSIPQHQIDLNAVTWGAFEFNEKSPTNIIIVTGDNPYQQGAIQKHIELARSKNLKTLRPPRNYGEAVAQFNQLKRDYPHWLAGKDNYVYQVLGLEELDLFQDVDFYHGELIEHKTHYQQLKQIPDFEMFRRLEALEEKLNKVTVLTEERDKHMEKLKTIKRLGW